MRWFDFIPPERYKDWGIYDGSAYFSTSGDAAGNTLGWNRLMTEVQSDRGDVGAVVLIPPGTYTFSGAVHAMRPNMILAGSGKGCTTMKCGGDVPSPNTFLQVPNDCTVRDLTVDIDGQNANGICIYEAKYCLVDNCEVINCPGYGYWVIDYAGQAGDLGVQYGHSTVRNCYVEAKEGFECFYVEEVNFDNCFAVGVADLGDGATASQNGFLIRDSCRGIRYTNCHATGAYTGNALKWTNNDDATLYETDGSIVNCKFENSTDNTSNFCMYFLDIAGVRVKNTVARGTNSCSGVFFSVTSTSRQDCRADIEVDVACADDGVALDHGKGSNVTYRGRFKTTSAQYLVELGTNSSVTDDITFDGCEFHFDSSHGTARLFKWNELDDVTYRNCKFIGDGTNYQMGDLGAASSADRVGFHGCTFYSTRINKFHDDGWWVHDSLFKNPADAAIGSGQYINCNGANKDYYSVMTNRYVLEGASPPTALVTADTAANKQVADNLEVI